MKDLWRNHREGGREVKKTLESREVDVETGWTAKEGGDGAFDCIINPSGRRTKALVVQRRTCVFQYSHLHSFPKHYVISLGAA